LGEPVDDEDLGLEWELEVREGEWCLLVAALEIGEGDDLGIRTGVDILLKRGCVQKAWEVLMDGVVD